MPKVCVLLVLLFHWLLCLLFHWLLFGDYMVLAGIDKILLVLDVCMCVYKCIYTLIYLYIYIHLYIYIYINYLAGR